jgi:predicted dehydrogenase
MKILKTVVVGLGRIGWRFHLPEVLSHDGFEAVGVVDPLPERRDEALKEHGVRGFADLDACLESTDVDLVVVASPTPFHKPQAIAAMRAGCDVFCDKPMAPSLEDADAMIDAARESGRKLMIYQPARARGDVAELKKILSQDIIGRVYMIKNRRTAYTRRNDWQSLRRNGGGMLSNYGAHQIDACLHVAASPARRITCHLYTIASVGDADDVVKALIETESGVLLDIDINMASAQPMLPTWQVLGTRGSLTFDEGVWRARYYRDVDLAPLAMQEGLSAEQRRYGSGEEIPWKDGEFPVPEAEPVDHYARCYDFYAADAAPLVPLAESRELMRVLDACRRSAGLRDEPGT